MPKVKSVKGFMDWTDFYLELGDAAGGNIVYGSKADLLEHQSCAKECGIVEVKVTFVKSVLGGVKSRGVSLEAFKSVKYQAKADLRWRKSLKAHIAMMQRRIKEQEKRLREVEKRIEKRKKQSPPTKDGDTK